MCCRLLPKLYKVALIVLLYCFIYYILRTMLRPQPVFTFVKEDVRIGDKYVLIHLISNTPVFSDVEGIDVFTKRQCGNCFITNNKGFLPLSEYDAVLVHGSEDLLYESVAFMEPDKRYLMEAGVECLERKLVGCREEPKVTSFVTHEMFDLRSLCHFLHEKRKKEPQVVV